MQAVQKQKSVCKGRGRGVLALMSFEPCPRPNKELANSHLFTPTKSVSTSSATQNGGKDIRGLKPVNVMSPLPIAQNEGDTQAKKSAVKLLAKYNFTSNPEQPGGFKELSITQKENLTLLCKGHPPSNNMLWWQVQNEDGEVGYVPAKYCMVMEENPTALPWLENKRLEEEAQRKKDERIIESQQNGLPIPDKKMPVVKAYQSAYAENREMSNGSQAVKKFYCDICDKQLNGPTPYSMHMSSKLHREEVEYLKSQGKM